MFAQQPFVSSVTGWHLWPSPERDWYPTKVTRSAPEHEAEAAEQHLTIEPTPRGQSAWIQVTNPACQAGDDVGPAGLMVQLDQSNRCISVRGELDVLTVPILATEMAYLDFGDTTLDFAGVSFIDAAGLGCLATFANQLAERDATLRIAGASAQLRRVFRVVQLDGLLHSP